jgi:hypothetical protein
VPLQDGEQVLKLCRRHWIYLWPSIAIYFLVAVIPPLVLGVLLDQAGGYHGVGEKIFWVVAWFYLGYWLVRIFLAWYRYRHDIWAITNQRLIDSYKRHPFSLRVSTADLVNVQDMTILRDGLLPPCRLRRHLSDGGRTAGLPACRHTGPARGPVAGRP